MVNGDEHSPYFSKNYDTQSVPAQLSNFAILDILLELSNFIYLAFQESL